MPNLAPKIYHSQISGVFENYEVSAPDSYDSSLLSNSPPPDFVISKKSDGQTLSRYSDSKWNINPYRSSCDVKRSLLNFDKFPESQVATAKHITFMLMYRFSASRSKPLTASTIECFNTALFKLAAFSESKGWHLSETLNTEKKFKIFLNSTNSSGCLNLTSALIGHLQSIGEEAYGFKAPPPNFSKLVKRRLSALKPPEQTPIVPSRILFEMIDLLSKTLNEIKKYIHRLTGFIDNLHQFSVNHPKIPSKKYTAYIKTSVKTFSLEKLFQKYRVTTQSSLASFIRRIFQMCQTYITIYSGMRLGETLALTCVSLKRTETSSGIQYFFTGPSTKQNGSEKSVRWVTCKDANIPYTIARSISLSLAKWINTENNNKLLSSSETPLFVSTGYLMPGKLGRGRADNLVRKSKTKCRKSDFINLFDQSNFTIQQCDLDDLNTVDPFRSWSTEEDFQLGATWKFKSLQYRRSLAYYASQSSLISFQSLKRQLKHLLRSMTYYYCNSQSAYPGANQADHISRLILQQKPISDAIAYEQNIIQSNETLHGANGAIIEKNLQKSGRVNLQETDRHSIAKSIKKGELSYAETPLGACTSIHPCDKKAAVELSACISCASAIIKMSKLEYAIKKLEAYLGQYTEKQRSSFEFRYDRMELQSLIEFRIRLKNKKENK